VSRAFRLHVVTLLSIDEALGLEMTILRDFGREIFISVILDMTFLFNLRFFPYSKNKRSCGMMLPLGPTCPMLLGGNNGRKEVRLFLQGSSRR
ncbi:MAG: hypothetical protein J6A47_00830, partial [Bacilli bacterium]|nr:hypothetical protein [Bacilli bacterium]